MDEDPESFDVRFTRTFSRRVLLELVALVAVDALAWRLEVLPTGLAIAFAVLVGVVAVVLAVFVRKTLANPVALRLDPTGAVLTGYPPLRWTDVATVEIGPVRPRRLLGAPRLVAAFVPRPGATRPGPASGSASRSAGRLRRRLYGTPLVLPVFAVDSSAEEVAAAVRRLGGVPVRRLPVRPLRRTLRSLVGLLTGAAAIVLVLLLLVLWSLVG